MNENHDYQSYLSQFSVQIKNHLKKVNRSRIKTYASSWNSWNCSSNHHTWTGRIWWIVCYWSKSSVIGGMNLSWICHCCWLEWTTSSPSSCARKVRWLACWLLVEVIGETQMERSLFKMFCWSKRCFLKAFACSINLPIRTLSWLKEYEATPHARLTKTRQESRRPFHTSIWCQYEEQTISSHFFVRVRTGKWMGKSWSKKSMHARSSCVTWMQTIGHIDPGTNEKLAFKSILGISHWVNFRLTSSSNITDGKF